MVIFNSKNMEIISCWILWFVLDITMVCVGFINQSINWWYNVGKTMPFSPPMTGNGISIPPLWKWWWLGDGKHGIVLPTLFWVLLMDFKTRLKHVRQRKRAMQKGSVFVAARIFSWPDFAAFVAWRMCEEDDGIYGDDQTLLPKLWAKVGGIMEPYRFRPHLEGPLLAMASSLSNRAPSKYQATKVYDTFLHRSRHLIRIYIYIYTHLDKANSFCCL